MFVKELLLRVSIFRLVSGERSFTFVRIQPNKTDQYRAAASPKQKTRSFFLLINGEPLNSRANTARSEILNKRCVINFLLLRGRLKTFVCQRTRAVIIASAHPERR
jgi:hypothetical protein